MIPSFEEFTKTLTEERLAEMFSDIKEINVVHISELSQENISAFLTHFQLQILQNSLRLNLRLLDEYHTWISTHPSQKTLLTQYCKEHHIKIGDCYCDDGWSGTNFDRPNFKRMIDDIELGKVNIVIVKDYCAIIGLNQKDLENQGILA